MWAGVGVVIVSFLALCATLRPYAPQPFFKDQDKLRFFRWPR